MRRDDIGRPRVALTLVAVASRFVPRAARRRWRLEWEAEILARWEEMQADGHGRLGRRFDLVGKAAGSLVDAMLYGRGRWRMDGMLQDLVVAVRTLTRKPGLAGVVVLTLSVGIGASTAMFSVAKDILLRPFPYPRPDDVVAVQGLHGGATGVAGNVSYPNMHDLGLATESLEALGATRWWSPALEDDRGSVVVRGATVTANYFAVLGVEAGIGRLFRPDEQGEGREPLLVITHPFWTERFGADPSVVGRELRLSGVTYRVIGVTADDFEDPWIMDGPGLEPRVFRTVANPPSDWPRSGRSWKGIARVRAGVSLAAAQEEVDAVFAGLVEAYPRHNAIRGVRLTPLRDRIAGPVRPVLLTLLAAVGILLLIACANLANLLLGRALDRRGEFAVHKALGAPGWRLFNRGLTEALVLSAAGGGLGLGLAHGLVGLAKGLGPMLPRPLSGEVDAGVLAFAVVATMGAGLLFGTAPALQAAGTEAVGVGSDGGRSMTSGRRGRRLRRGLVVGELALTTLLLVAAGLLVRSFQRLGAVDLGMRTEGVLTVELHGSAWWELEPEAALAQWRAVLESVRSLPSVEAVGAIDYVPLGGSYSCDGVQREDRPPPDPGEGMCAETRMILPGTLETLGVPLLRGRLLEDTDLAGQPNVALIDLGLAERMWPGEDPVGKRLEVHNNVHEVVGVVGNMLHFGPAGDERPQLYLHASQDGWNGIARGLTVLARGSDPGVMAPAIRAVVAEVNASIAVGTVETLYGFLASSLSAQRFRTSLMAAFALTALLLAVLGVTGVMNYTVARRTREMGLRLALGADPGEVRDLVLREGVRLAALGVGLGLVAALFLAGLLDDALLFEVGARDPGVYSGVALLLCFATAVACYVPASRASGVDPVSALTEV